MLAAMATTTAASVPVGPTPLNERSGPLRDTIARQALAVAKGVALAPFAVIGVVFFVMAPAAVAIKLSDWAFASDSVTLEALVVALLATVTFAWLWFSVARGAIKALLRYGRFQPTVQASSLALLAAVSFTTLTALLYEQGLIGIAPAPPSDRVLDVTFEYYLWALANTVPLVDIPGNLEWAKPFEFDGALGGLLVIVFTGFVVFPLIQLARLILGGAEASYDVAVVRALQKHVGDDQLATVHDPSGYERALIDRSVFVDVIRDVRNHDGAERRLERLGALASHQRPRGYLLVVDAIAEGARDRVELALAQAPFPARLAVWRSDQPARDLTDAFDALRARLTAPSP
jgi:hypothetical protein